MRASATSGRKCFEWLTSFLKRRWILLSGAVVLLACSMIDFFRTKSAPLSLTGFGLRHGRFEYVDYHRVHEFGDWYSRPIQDMQFIKALHRDALSLHPPCIGAAPQLRFSANERNVIVPLWLPLTAVLGWIVIRELRWRENRAKTAQATP